MDIAQYIASIHLSIMQRHKKPQSNRKLQPVEILTNTGEWIGGYFVHQCISVGNLVNIDRQFTLFDANGDMCRFLGRIRSPQGCVVR